LRKNSKDFEKNTQGFKRNLGVSLTQYDSITSFEKAWSKGSVYTLGSLEDVSSLFSSLRKGQKEPFTGAA
jgi:hypothetical protein